jgi:predicted RNA polymerase sigma factor
VDRDEIAAGHEGLQCALTLRALLRRLDRDSEARQAYERPLELVPGDVERDFLRARLERDHGQLLKRVVSRSKVGLGCS